MAARVAVFNLKPGFHKRQKHKHKRKHKNVCQVKTNVNISIKMILYAYDGLRSFSLDISAVMLTFMPMSLVKTKLAVPPILFYLSDGIQYLPASNQ